MNHNFEKVVKISENLDVLVKSGKLAKRCDSSFEIRFKNNVLLVTFVFSKEDSNNSEFLPLHVDYQEKFYSVGRIPYGCKREVKLNDHEVLVSRLIDRSIRPCFPENYKKESQVVITVLSYDKDYDPKYLACFGTSLCLLSSEIGFNGPVSEAFLYLIDNQWVVNPSKEQISNSLGKLVIGGTENHLLMCEGSIDGINKEKLLEGINIGLSEVKKQCQIQLDLLNIDKNRQQIVNQNCTTNENYVDELYKIYKETDCSTDEKNNKINKFLADNQTISVDILKECKKEAFKKLLFNDRIRIDGREINDIRKIECDIDYLPSAHGSALFTRGDTQALVTVTLGDKRDEQPIEEAYLNGYNKLVLHYNFPSFCVGELSYSKSTSRREIGHGNLALGAIKYIIPNDNLFTIRIVSDILSSDGSSSMATVCGSCLALKDAGIKINETIAGIAMGLVFYKENNDYLILTDITSDEDEL